jgi:Hypothetical glycosyl hydrolase family 15
MQHLLRVTTTLAALVILLAVTSSTASAASPETGQVRFIKEAKSDFDRYTRNPSPQRADWMRDHFFRQKAYAPYFDQRLSWYPNGWAYKDLYAIYVDEDLAREHPEWILRDSQGRKLYIPWGCSGGTCPQYAGDVGNPAFRAHWISQARATMAAGYKGLFVDDVNMEFRVGDGSGEEVAPIDPRSGRTMSHASWRRYVAEFVEGIRGKLAGVEVAHNPIWYSGHADESVRRALLAADYVNLERGVNDKGLTRGGGQFGYETLLEHVDWLHGRGKAVVFDSYAKDRAGAEYNLASYFLVNGTRDGFRTDYRAVPDDWWTGYDVDLGAARGGRYEWRGLLRRDFKNGYVLVNQPRSPTRTVRLPARSRGADGGARGRVRLAAGSGAVVLGRAPRGRAPILRRPVPNPAGALASAEGGRRAEGLRGAVLVRGRVRGGYRSASRVRIGLQRRAGGRWVSVRRKRTAIRQRGRFKQLVRGLAPGRYRVSARLGGSATTPGPAATRRFRITR